MCRGGSPSSESSLDILHYLGLPDADPAVCSQAFPAHLSPAWGPTDRASCWPKQAGVWEPQKV